MRTSLPASCSSVPRRTLLKCAGMGGMTALLPGFSAALAQTQTRRDARLVLIILRGALDGLAAVAPYADANYRRWRGALALPEPGADQGALKLDGLFALHPALVNLHARYQAKEMLPIHAVASPYRERSHFDGQDLLENGTNTPHGALDGWLNRALPGLAAQQAHRELAIAYAQNMPLVLRGDQHAGSWMPSRLPDTDADTLQRLTQLYADDAYFLSRLQTAIATDALASEGAADMKTSNKDNGARNDQLGQVVTAAGRMLKEAEGPRIAVMETTGWDTHANQGAQQGVLATRLSALDAAIEKLRVELDEAWRDTVVMVVTEFGRTVAINGTRGTDHGTGTVAFLVGGAVNGGRVVCDWPGLASGNLYQARDLAPTTDLRSVFKGVLLAHMGVSEAWLETRVFANSRQAKPLADLLRSV